jgi:Ricin-type beta-trefoil lectin domain-like
MTVTVGSLVRDRAGGRLCRALPIGIGSVMAVVSVPATALHAHASGYGGFIHAYGHQNLCVDDTGWSTSQGTRLQLYPCTGNSNQYWYENIFSCGQYCGEEALLQNAYSGLCINVSGASTANFTPAIQWGCSPTYTNEVFKVLPAPGTSGPPNFNFWVGIGTCLDDPYNSGSTYTKLEFYHCNESVAQTWYAPGMRGVWP